MATMYVTYFGASLSEPHTDEYYVSRVYMYVYMLFRTYVLP